MPDLVGHSIGKLLTVLGYDGTYFRNLHVDAAGDPQVDVLTSALPTGAATEVAQAPLGKDRSKELLWDAAVAAGATHALLAERSGSGYLTDVMFRAKGAAATCYTSEVHVTLDGTQVAEFRLAEMLYLNNGAVLGFAGIECFKWDDVGFEYWVHWKVAIPFKDSIQIDVVNGDGANVTTMRVMVVYRIDL